MDKTKNLFTAATCSFALLLAACGSDNSHPTTPITPLPTQPLSLAAPGLDVLENNQGMQDFADAHGLPTFFDTVAAERGETLFSGKATRWAV